MLTITDLSFRYPSQPDWQLKDINLQLQAGQRWALLGPNGSGKSTLLGVMAGLNDPQKGRVQWQQDDVPIGWLPAAVTLPPYQTVAEFIRFLADLRGNYQATLTQDLVDRLALGTLLSVDISRLSFGQAQRVRLAQLLAAQPRVLLLDEPTTGIDLEGALCLEQLMNHASENGVCCVYATHQLDEAVRICDGAWMLAHGRLMVTLTGENWASPAQVQPILRRVAFDVPKAVE